MPVSGSAPKLDTGPRAGRQIWLFRSSLACGHGLRRNAKLGRDARDQPARYRRGVRPGGAMAAGIGDPLRLEQHHERQILRIVRRECAENDEMTEFDV